MNKVQDGTPNHTDHLCASCRMAVITRGQNLQEERIVCRVLSPNALITHRVSFCTEYSDRSTTSLYEMQEIAWTLTTSPGRKVGFVSPQELRRRDGQ